MALGGILATALTDHSARAKGLYLNSVDVLLAPGTEGNRPGTPIETVTVKEAGPNGVSSMDFTIEDPGLAIAIAEGMDVRLEDITRDYPIFRGFVDTWEAQPAFGGQGRTIEVSAIGVETVLDWAVLPADLVFAIGTLISTSEVVTAIQSIVAQAIGLGPIRDFAVVAAQSTQAHPIDFTGMGGNALTDQLTITAGTSVREAIRQLHTARFNPTAGLNQPGSLLVTVDFTMGLRVWSVTADFTADPPDYAGVTIVDTVAGAIAAANLRYSVDAGGVVRTVIVKGTGITAIITDGTGLQGQAAILEDATITTAAKAQIAGAAYLRSFASGLRGSYRLEDATPPAGVHAGSVTTITDVQVGLAAAKSRIYQIDKTFQPSQREDWLVAFGGPPPSGAALIRRLTRGTLS